MEDAEAIIWLLWLGDDVAVKLCDKSMKKKGSAASLDNNQSYNIWFVCKSFICVILANWHW